MESVSRLRDVLVRILSGGQEIHAEQELFDQLMVQKLCLLNLLDFGRRNQQEQREIESGRSIILVLRELTTYSLSQAGL